ncbi:hypothetical protein GCM10027586_09410 [Kineococcus gypseus]
MRYLLQRGWSAEDVRTHRDASSSVVDVEALVGSGAQATTRSAVSVRSAPASS